MLKRVIYTNMDTLMDTTATIYHKLDSRLIVEYISDITSIPDQVGYVSDSIFRDLYSKRDKDILTSSSANRVLELLRQISSDMQTHDVINDNHNKRIELHINTYPYIMNDDEQLAISEFYKTMILHLSEVVIHYKENIMDDNYIDSISVLVDRYGLEWYLAQKIDTPNFNKPNIKLITSDRLPRASSVVMRDINHDKLRLYLETIVSTTIGLELMDDALFKMRIL